MTRYTEKELQRMEISLHMTDFYRRGGRVTVVEYGLSAFKDEPIKLTRKEQIEKMRGKREKG